MDLVIVHYTENDNPKESHFPLEYESTTSLDNDAAILIGLGMLYDNSWIPGSVSYSITLNGKEVENG